MVLFQRNSWNIPRPSKKEGKSLVHLGTRSGKNPAWEPWKLNWASIIPGKRANPGWGNRETGVWEGPVGFGWGKQRCGPVLKRPLEVILERWVEAQGAPSGGHRFVCPGGASAGNKKAGELSGGKEPRGC